MFMKLKCAVIGLGRIGCGFDDDPDKKSISTHVGAYNKIEKTELVALCDSDQIKLKKYSEKFCITNSYTNIKEMFEKENLDCISICTLMDSHLEIVKEAGNYKIKGIFIEKPISDTLENTAEIIRLCKKNKIKLQVDHQRRFSPVYQKIKKIINKDEFGDIQHASIYYGAGISNTGSHLFDLMRYFFGNIQYVKGHYSKNISHKVKDLNIDGNIIFKNGVKCSIHAFDVSNFGILEFDIISTKARIKINLVLDSVEYFEIAKEKEGLQYNELSPKHFEIKKVDSIVLGLENLVDCIEKNKEPLCSGLDGYYSVEAIKAMISSADNNGEKIYFPMNVDSYNIATKMC